MENRLRRRQLLGSGMAVAIPGLAGCNSLNSSGNKSYEGGETEEDDGGAGSEEGERGNETQGEDTTVDKGDSDDNEETDRPEPLDTVRTVGAHYYPWYGAPVGDFRDGEWSLESPSTPVLGNYNSTDPEVIAQHINWCHIAGIEWLNVSWRGPDHKIDDRIRNDILDHPRAKELEWSILYETGPQLGDNPVDMDDPRTRRKLRTDLEYLSETYFDRDQYKHVDGRPVLYVYTANRLNRVGDLVGAYEEAVEAAGVRPYLIADITDPTTFGSTAISEVADAITVYNPYAPREDIEQVFFERFEQSNRAWYLARDYTDLDIIPTVIPGFNDSEVTHVARDNPVLESSPERYERLCEMTTQYTDGPVFVTSFNEWYENTMIEPSKEYGEEYLEITADTLATDNRDPPTIEGESVSLVFERTISESELNPDLEYGRDLTMNCDRLRVYDDEGSTIIDADVGGEEADLLFLMGTYEQGQSETDRWRWFGGSEKTIIHLPEFPKSGSLEMLGMAAAEISVDVVVDGELRGQGTVDTNYDTYRIEIT